MPLAGKPLILAAALVYLALVTAIGIWSGRRTRSARDFFIAGQRVGLLVTAMATMSAAFSGFVFLGGPGLTYRIGLASLFVVVPVGFTAGMLCWVVGGRLRALAGTREIFTVPDALAARYRSRAVAGLAALAVVCGSVAYLGLQLQALGILLRSILGTQSLWQPMLLGLAILALYCFIGGMVAGVYTDLLQGGLMLATAVAVFACALRVNGGWFEMLRVLRGPDGPGPGFLEPLGGAGAYTAFGFFFVFGIGVLGQPHMLHKFYMLDDPRKLRWMPLLLGGSQTVCLLVWLGIGLAVPALVSQGRLAPLANADEAAPLFLVGFAPGLVAGLAFAGILAAIMSTADSFVNIGSAALVRDLPRAIGRRVANELAWGRAAVLLIAGVAALLAWLWGDLIVLLGTFAFGTFAAALAPAVAVGLVWERITARAAGASIAAGLLLNLLLELLDRQRIFSWLPASPLPPGVLPAAVALAASFTVLFAVSWWDTRSGPTPVDDDVLAAMDA